MYEGYILYIFAKYNSYRFFYADVRVCMHVYLYAMKFPTTTDCSLCRKHRIHTHSDRNLRFVKMFVKKHEDPKIAKNLINQKKSNK